MIRKKYWNGSTMNDIWPTIFTYSDVVTQRMLSSTSKWWLPFRDLNSKVSLTVKMAEYGYLDLLIWAHTNNFLCQHERICEMAAFNGHLEILKWVYSKGIKITHWVASSAAKKGHLEILKWLKLNYCHIDSFLYANAAINNHLEILKWARENNCPWNSIYRNALDAVLISNGNTEIIKWVEENL